jgi:hypothetical protein
MVINFKRTGARFGQALALAGVLIFTGSSVVNAQTMSPLMSSTPPSSEMGITVAPHAETIYTLVPQLRTQLTDNYAFLKPATPKQAGFLYKVIGYNFNTLADTRYESSVANTYLKTTIKNSAAAQQKGLEVAAAVGQTLTANEYTVPMPSRVPVVNDATRHTVYYERDDSVVVVMVEKGNVSIVADTRQALWTSAALTTTFVEELIAGNTTMQHVKGDKTSSWWQGAARQGKTLTFSRPVFSGVAQYKQADMFVGTSQKDGRNHHFVWQDDQWKLAGHGHDQHHWRKK